jgi:uncharacterized LabA/DUF88 family protein
MSASAQGGDAAAPRRQRVAIFVDVQNIYYTTRQAYQAHFDYKAFWRQASSGRTVVTANAYAIERDDPRQRQFQQILRAIGFEVKLKPFITRADGSAKGDWDVGITLDVIDCSELVDVVVLASGDGDFEPLLRRLRERHGIVVEVYGVARLTAGALKQAADHFVPIDERLLLPAR